MATEFYLINVRKMMTSDDCDLVPGWTAHISSDNLPNLMLADVAQLLTMEIKDAPVSGLRPMTEDEVKEWRKEQDDED